MPKRGREYLVYVRVDNEVDATRDMTPKELATANPGNYFLAAIRVR
jgi:hypothetical protein